VVEPLGSSDDGELDAGESAGEPSPEELASEFAKSCVSAERAAGVELLAAFSEPPDVLKGAAHEASLAAAERPVVSVAVAEVCVVVPQGSVAAPELSVLSGAAHEASVAVAEVPVIPVA